MAIKLIPARVACVALSIGIVVALPNRAVLADETGRYQVLRTDEGFIRIDTATGSVSHCQRQKGVWTCSRFDTQGDSMRKEIATLTAQNRALKQRLAVLEEAVALHQRERAKAFELPDEQQFDEMMGFLERAIRRFRKFARALQDVPGQDI